MPTTTEEFEAVLQAFKDQDANGNGDPTDEIPFSADPNNKHIEGMTGWFGFPMDKTGIGMLNEEVTYGGISSTYREFLSWFNSLYEKGLIDVELFTQDTSTWEGKGNQDMYGVSIAYGSNEFSGIPQSPEKPPYDVLPVLNVEKGGKWLRSTPVQTPTEHRLLSQTTLNILKLSAVGSITHSHWRTVSDVTKDL